jgi:hypothetical protein
MMSLKIGLHAFERGIGQLIHHGSVKPNGLDSIVVFYFVLSVTFFMALLTS